MKRTTPWLLCLLAIGCTTRTIQIDANTVYKSTRFGNKENIGEITYTSKDGTKLTVKAFRSDQVEALGVITEAAVKAAITSAK